MAVVERLGLRTGETVRFRRPGRLRWQEGRAAAIERDGSLLIHDHDGAARAIPVELVEVQARGPRGARRWEPLLDRIMHTEQLTLF